MSMWQRIRGGWLWPAIVFAVLASSCTGGAGDEASAIVDAFMQESGLPGLAVTVGRSGQVVYSEGFGYADLEQRVPVDPAVTRFRVGSTAKSMTAMAIGQLVEAGKLDLDAPIQAYLPDFPEKRAPITTRMLAGHLGGITRMTSFSARPPTIPFRMHSPFLKTIQPQ